MAVGLLWPSTLMWLACAVWWGGYMVWIAHPQGGQEVVWAFVCHLEAAWVVGSVWVWVNDAQRLDSCVSLVPWQRTALWNTLLVWVYAMMHRADPWGLCGVRAKRTWEDEWALEPSGVCVSVAGMGLAVVKAALGTYAMWCLTWGMCFDVGAHSWPGAGQKGPMQMPRARHVSGVGAGTTRAADLEVQSGVGACVDPPAGGGVAVGDRLSTPETSRAWMAKGVHQLIVDALSGISLGAWARVVVCSVVSHTGGHPWKVYVFNGLAGLLMALCRVLRKRNKAIKWVTPTSNWWWEKFRVASKSTKKQT